MFDSEKYKRIIEQGATQQEAFAWFDQLETVNSADILGLWKGIEIKTGHPLEGVLSASNWFGKRFINEEQVYPLVCLKNDGTLYNVNPWLLPLDLPIDKLPSISIKLGMKLFRPLLATDKSSARIRMTNYRDKTSASLIYDDKAIIDVFRKIDNQTLLGVMDFKTRKVDKSYFFVLKKVR
ncbi:DUF4334 domain-containing protein [Amphibacillus cookii]|uniref:DUF4334 domain-containing protein n=1 Tax=Amphibacillus cookii TaxID=767787 RepID=UPI0019598AF8|nr:DUF4334 domain-containing protein [Amphibacillus cookii]MBM7541837.1 hypothetical protein [Amphibacillus cookii]